MKVSYLTRNIGNVEVFYREAGPADAPVILLLHGFPTSSHMFRNLIPLLAQDYRVIAPDLPGFGNTKAPPRGTFDYTFDNLARVIDEFTISLGLKRYAIYAFDYGAPTGYRLAVAHPEYEHTRHRKGGCRTRPSPIDWLYRLCPHHHHHLKTSDGWALVPGTGKRAFVPPHDPRYPRRA